MGGGILLLSRKFCKLSPPPRPDSLSLTQISRGRGDSSSKRKVSAKILLGKLKEKAEENNQKLKSYFLCWALKFHKYLIIVCYMYFIKIFIQETKTIQVLIHTSQLTVLCLNFLSLEGPDIQLLPVFPYQFGKMQNSTMLPNSGTYLIIHCWTQQRY